MTSDRSLQVSAAAEASLSSSFEDSRCGGREKSQAMQVIAPSSSSSPKRVLFGGVYEVVVDGEAEEDAEGCTSTGGESSGNV